MTKQIAIVKGTGTIIIGQEAIRSAIATITKSGQRLDDLIQSTAVGVLNHIDLHGNVTLLNELYAGMPKGSRKLALAEWCLKFGRVIANVDPKTKKAMPFSYDHKRSTDLAGAQLKPWYDFKPEPMVDQAFDFAAMLGALLSKADKAASDPTREVKGADLLAKVRALSLASL